MKQLISLVLLCLLFPSLSFAQANFQKGYVVTTAGDTLRGEIDYREWNLNPDKISFRATANSGEPKEFDASSARYFTMDGLMESYRSYQGPITMDQVSHDNLQNGSPDTTVVNRKVFLKVRQQGPVVTLYSYRDNLKQRYFILESDTEQPQELRYKRYYKSTGNHLMVTQRYYIGQLLNVARNRHILTDKLQREIESADYEERDLLQVVSKLNGMSEQAIAEHKFGAIGTAFFAGVALSRGTLELEGQVSFSETDANPPSYMPQLTFGIDGFLNKNVQRTVLRLEGGLKSSAYQLQRNEPSGGGSYYEISYFLTMQTASFSPQILYSLYNRENLKLFAGAGFSLNFSNYSKNTYQRKYYNPKLNEVSVHETEDYKDLIGAWSTYVVRTGVVLRNRYEVSAVYMAPGAITHYAGYSISNGSLNIGVNYLFR